MSEIVQEASNQAIAANRLAETVEQRVAQLEDRYYRDEKYFKQLPKQQKLIEHLNQTVHTNVKKGNDLQKMIESVLGLHNQFVKKQEDVDLSLNTRFDELYEFSHREVDYYDKIQEGCDNLRTTIQKEFDKLLKKVLESLYEQDKVMASASLDCDRISRMQKDMIDDVKRHEVISFELAHKFEAQHDVLIQFADNIEALKTYALATDLHLEAYQPLQSAAIAYEVARGGIPRNRIEKFQQCFSKKVLRQLEKNCLNVCDPSDETYNGFYRKMCYRLPTEIENLIQGCEHEENEDKKEDTTFQWENILSKVSLSNINLFNEQSKGKRRLNSHNDPRSSIAETLVRRDVQKSKLQLLSGKPGQLSEKEVEIPLQQNFEQMQQVNIAQMKIPLELSGLKKCCLPDNSICAEMLQSSRAYSGQNLRCAQEDHQVNSGNALKEKMKKIREQREQKELQTAKQKAIDEKLKNEYYSTFSESDVELDNKEYAGLTRQQKNQLMLKKQRELNKLELALFSKKAEEIQDSESQQSSDPENPMIPDQGKRYLENNIGKDMNSEPTEKLLKDQKKFLLSKIDQVATKFEHRLNNNENNLKVKLDTSIQKLPEQIDELVQEQLKVQLLDFTSSLSQQTQQIEQQTHQIGQLSSQKQKIALMQSKIEELAQKVQILHKKTTGPPPKQIVRYVSRQEKSDSHSSSARSSQLSSESSSLNTKTQNSPSKQTVVQSSNGNSNSAKPNSPRQRFQSFEAQNQAELPSKMASSKNMNSEQESGSKREVHPSNQKSIISHKQTESSPTFKKNQISPQKPKHILLNQTQKGKSFKSQKIVNFQPETLQNALIDEQTFTSAVESENKLSKVLISSSSSTQKSLKKPEPKKKAKKIDSFEIKKEVKKHVEQIASKPQQSLFYRQQDSSEIFDSQSESKHSAQSEEFDQIWVKQLLDKEYVSKQYLDQQNLRVLKLIESNQESQQERLQCSDKQMQDVIQKTKKIDLIDWDAANKAESVMNEFRETVQTFTQKLQTEFKSWRQKNTDLFQKYENISVWVQMFNEMCSRLKEELFRGKIENRKTFESLFEYMDLQMSKDIQDDIDRQKMGLYATEEKNFSSNVGSPKSGDIAKKVQNLMPNESPLSVSQKCFNCFGSTGKDKSAILNCFKIACINYASSEIQLSTGLCAQREQVTQLQQSILSEMRKTNKDSADLQSFVEKQLMHLSELKLSNSQSFRPQSPRFLQTSITKTFEDIIKKHKHKYLNKDSELKSQREFRRSSHTSIPRVIQTSWPPKYETQPTEVLLQSTNQSVYNLLTGNSLDEKEELISMGSDQSQKKSQKSHGKLRKLQKLQQVTRNQKAARERAQTTPMQQRAKHMVSSTERSSQSPSRGVISRQTDRAPVVLNMEQIYKNQEEIQNNKDDEPQILDSSFMLMPTSRNLIQFHSKGVNTQKVSGRNSPKELMKNQNFRSETSCDSKSRRMVSEMTQMRERKEQATKISHDITAKKPIVGNVRDISSFQRNSYSRCSQQKSDEIIVSNNSKAIQKDGKIVNINRRSIQNVITTSKDASYSKKIRKGTPCKGKNISQDSVNQSICNIVLSPKQQ